MLHEEVVKDDKLLIWSEKTGFMWGWAKEDKNEFSGLAYFQVSINAAALPGVNNMSINLNTFDVWKADNPEGLLKVAQHYVKMDVVR